MADVKGVIDAATQSAAVPQDKSILDTLGMNQPTADTSVGDLFSVVKRGLAQRESGDNYNAQSPNSSAAGKYQFIDSTREQFAPGSDRESFKANPQLQEDTMDKLMMSNLHDLQRAGIDVDNIPKADVAGLLYAAHLQGSGAAARLYMSGQDSGGDANGVTANNYFQLGKQNYLKATNSFVDHNPSLFSAPGEHTLAAQQIAAQTPVDSWDYIKNSYKAAKDNLFLGQVGQVSDGIDSAVEKINKATGGSYAFPNFMQDIQGNMSLGETASAVAHPIEHMRDKFDELLNVAQSEHPDVKLPYANFSDILSEVGKQQEARAANLAEQAPRTHWSTYLEGMLGGMAGYASDPINLAVSAAAAPVLGAAGIGAGAGILGRAAIQGGVAGVAQAIQEPAVQQTRGEMGLEHGASQGLSDVANVAGSTAAFSGILGLLAKGLGSAIKSPTVTDFQNKLFNSPSKEFAAEAAKAGVPEPEAYAASEMARNAPSGFTPKGQEDMSMRIDKVYSDIQSGNRVTVIPPEITGIKGGEMPTDISHLIQEHLEDEGFHSPEVVSKAFKDIQEAMKNKGNVTPEEYQNTPPPELNTLSSAEQITNDRLKEQDIRSEALGKPDTAAQLAVSDLKDSLALDPDKNSQLIAQRSEIESKIAKSNTLKDQIEYMNSGKDLEDNFDYGNHDRADVIYGRNKRLDAMLQDIEQKKQQYEENHFKQTGLYPHEVEEGLPDELRYSPSKKFSETPREAPQEVLEPTNPEAEVKTLPSDFDKRYTALSQKFPDAEEFLKNSIDLQNGQANGIKLHLDENAKQGAIYNERYQSLASQMEAADPHEKLMLESQAMPYKQALDEYANDLPALEKRAAMVNKQLEDYKASAQLLDSVKSKVQSLKEGDDPAPLYQAEALVNRLQAQREIMSGKYLLDNGEKSFSDQVNGISESYSMLKQLKDCIG